MMETTPIAFLTVHSRAWTCSRMLKSGYSVLFGIYQYPDSKLVLPIRLYNIPLRKTKHYRQMPKNPYQISPQP